MRRAETVIVGGGPAGSATAFGLAALGRDVMLIERTAKPHNKVCGEFLSVETQTQLQRLGVDPSSLGAVPVERLALYSSSRSVTSALPFRALSLSRYRLDDALLQCARNSGARLKRNVAVKSVTPAGTGWNVLCDEGEIIYCRHLVLATGKLGLRGVDDARDGSLVGLKMHLRLSPAARRALEGRVELFFLDDGYIGLELIEDGIANLCFVLSRATVARLGSGWPALHAYLASALPSLTERLAGAEPLWDKPLAVVCPTGGHLHRERGIADLSRRRPARPYPTVHRRRPRHRARIRCAGGRAHSARPPARRLSSSGAATHGHSHPAGEHRLRPRQEQRRTQLNVRGGGLRARPDRDYRPANPADARRGGF